MNGSYEKDKRLTALSELLSLWCSVILGRKKKCLKIFKIATSGFLFIDFLYRNGVKLL